MKSWIQRTLLGLVGAFFTVGALTACGHHRDHAGWGASAEEQASHRAKVVDRIASRLDLNATQKAKLADLATKLAAQRAALAGGQPDPRAQVRALVAGDKFDRAGAQALLTKTTSAIQAGSPEVIAALADFYDSLDPQQQAKVRERLQQHRRGWWRRG